jgi:protein SFI1
VQALSDGRCLKTALNVWKAKLQEKRQAQWRDAMRYKIKVVRTNRENKLKKDAWAKWRQSYQSHLSGQHYTERLVSRFFQQWKKKLVEVDHLDATAEEYDRVREDRALVRCWGLWKRASQLKSAERVMAERVDLRIISEVLSVWKRHMCVCFNF